MFRTFTIAALFALAATTAQAESSTQVAFGDLNLSRTEDAQILADRLQTAAKMVCLDANHIPGGIGRAEMQECVDAAISTATARIEEQIRQHLVNLVHANLVSVRQRVSSADDFQH
jgi:UrcA family protein